MAKYSLPEFIPELRVVAREATNKRLVVVFDTATDIDLKRSPRIVMIDTEGVISITTSVDPVAVDDRVLKQGVTGKINLLTQKSDGSQEKHLLADFELLIDGGKRDKDGHLNFPPLAEIEQVIRQGVADAFTDASMDMAHGELPAQRAVNGATGDSGVGVMLPPSQGRFASVRASVMAKPWWRQKMYLLFGFLGLVLLAATIKITTASADPVQAAVSKALANDPRARDEQIEITRQTLKEMGLDPGKNGDLGCLAAQ